MTPNLLSQMDARDGMLSPTTALLELVRKLMPERHEVYVMPLTDDQIAGLKAELGKDDCPHDSLYPLIHSSFDAPGAWTHCNDCGAPVEITSEMESRWSDHYEHSVANGERYTGMMGYNDPDDTMPPMA